jgi:anti-anti-sigma factor
MLRPSTRPFEKVAIKPPLEVVGGPSRSAVISCSGELDRSNARELRRALAAAIGDGSGALLLDLMDVEFIDAGILSAIVAAAHRLKWRGDRLEVAAGRQPLRLLELTEATQMMRVYRCDPSSPSLFPLPNRETIALSRA